MQPTISLASYAIRVWDADERAPDVLSDFADGVDLFDFLREFLGDLKKNPSHDEEGQQIVRVQEFKVAGRQIRGLIETGEYGSASELWDVRKKALAHERTITEADMIPFYFLFDLPIGQDEGFIVLERRGMLGIRTTLSHALQAAFTKKFPGYQLRFQPLVNAKEIEKYAKGKIESVHFIRFDIPKDVADAFEGGHKEVKGRAEFVVHALRGRELPLNSKLRTFLRGGTKVGDWIALDETNFEYQNVKVTTRVGRSRRTIDFSKVKQLRSYHDITDAVKIDIKTGNPEFDSINQLAESLVEQIRSQIVKNNGTR